MARCAATVVLTLLHGASASESLRSAHDVPELRHAAKDISQSLAWSSEGCYTDARDRIFEKMSEDTSLTTAKCAEDCADYPYYGVQFGKECWCGNYRANYARYGSSSDCTVKCSGDSSETCGGRWAMNVYSQAEEDTASVGCYADERNDRVFYNQWVHDSSMTPEWCKVHCDKVGAEYYATQYGNECWCGQDTAEIDKHGPATCDVPCSGDPTKICGGTWAMTVYSNSAAPPPPTPTPPSPTPTPSATMPTPAPTPVWEMPEYDPACTKASWRYAASTGPSGRAYIEGSGGDECFTLTDLYLARGGKPPLYVTDELGNELPEGAVPTGHWLLKGELYVTGGAILYVHGTNIGGDADTLRIQSEDDGLFHEVRGHGGSLSFKSTFVTSWDTTTGAVREEYEGGRSFINCVSEKDDDQTCEGNAKNDMGECRMDIIDSEMGHLGYFDSESYGLTWKVRGFCVDKSNPEVFDNTDVFGDIKNSDIHHMYYGMYSYGHQGGVWTNNKMHDNHQYGFDPHDDSDYLTISGNEVWNNVNHGIIASKRCNHVKIFDNEVYDGGAQAAGIFLHRSTDSCEVYDNYVHDMYDAGIANLESSDSKVYNNIFKNVKYGIRISLGGQNNEIYDNTFENCSQYGLYTYMGSDPPDVTDGRPSGNIFRDNTVTKTATGVRFKEADDTQCYDNTFEDVEKFQFTDSTNTFWENNSHDGACTSNTDSTFDSASSGLPDSC